MDVSQHVRAIISFIESAQMGSFSEAARKLGISPAAVSKNIAALEKALGVRLMNRTTRKISLTEEGATFLSQSMIAMNALDSAVESIISRKMETSGHVRISTSAGFGRDQLLPALPSLLSQYPQLTIEADFDDRMIDLVNDGYDIAIRGGRFVDSNLITRPVCNLNLVLVASPEYLSKYGNPKTVEDLKSHQLLSRRFLGGKILPWEFKSFDDALLALDPIPSLLTISAPEALASAAACGLGIAQVGIHHAYKYLEAGNLKVVLLDIHNPGKYEMVIQYPHRSLIAPRVKVTVEHLLNHFKNDKSLHIQLKDLIKYQF
ncbi:LysR family transcriptional regulator [Rosenbergiella epipactidis]|uniref:LysR family transcriptional regulator n=1 Tax=Rosenbergiella epipactidis TaxID=1544694 RepID=UPI001F4D432D|nr:LysR family transcriptional regulator [Rosenbergiella epipactidis]